MAKLPENYKQPLWIRLFLWVAERNNYVATVRPKFLWEEQE